MQQGHRPSLRMSINRVWMIFLFASCLIYVQIGSRLLSLWHWQPLLRKTTLTCSLLLPQNWCQRRFDDVHLLKMPDLCFDWLQTSVFQTLAHCTGKTNSDMLPAACWQWESQERQHFLALHFHWFLFRLVADIHLSNVASLDWRNRLRNAPCGILKMIVNRASTVLLVAYLVINSLC